MAAKNNIAEVYHKRVDEFLDNQSSLNLSDPLSQGEQDEIWEEISSEMDIGEIWNSISSNLDRLMPLSPDYGFIFKSFAVVLIFALALIPVKKEILNSGIVQEVFLNHHEQVENTSESIIYNKPEVPDPQERVNAESQSLSVLGSGKEEDDPNRIPSGDNRMGKVYRTPVIEEEGFISGMTCTEEEVDVNIPVPQEEIQFEKPGISFDLLKDLPEHIEILTEINLNDSGLKSIMATTGISIPSINQGRISVGLITMVKNTWLLNRETFNGLNAESLNTTLVVFSPDVGLSLNYSLNNYWKLQADGFYYSNTGQEYMQYIYGHYSRKNITLTYSKIALSAKYKLAGKKGVMGRPSVNLVAGSYLSLLHHASQKITDDLENIESHYRKFDYGLRIGSELSLHLFDHFSLVPGLFLSIGIPNIYKGDGYIPGYFRKTHNANAGFQLVFYYSL
ncbi:MAG: hypothetical protein JXA39_03795 [Bacteroidales bacterium]|nr:hypothetical protein [Bacteroidales bacterium]